MLLLELSDYHLDAIGAGSDFSNVYFGLSKSDICQIQTDSTDDVHNFLKALATLVYPISGSYRFMGEEVNFSDYRNLLSIKKKIGYIGQDATMVSNRTIRENLLLMKSYHENSLSASLDEKALRLCEMSNLHDKLDARPGELRSVDLRMAIAIRELTKSFDVLLLDCPEDYFGHSAFDPFNEIFQNVEHSGKGIVFFSRDHDFARHYANRKVSIVKGALTKIPL